MEIRNFKKIIGDERVLAQFSVYIPAFDWTINFMQIKKNGKGGWFVSHPSRREEIDGQFKYTPINQVGEKRKKEFDNEVYRLVKAEAALHGIN